MHISELKLVSPEQMHTQTMAGAAGEWDRALSGKNENWKQGLQLST